MWSAISFLHGVIERLVASCLTYLVYACCFLAVAHSLGWLERWIWWTLEKEACKLLNGTKLTLGSFRLDWSEILQGKITLHASNAVLHTPQREEWGWDSPLIARVGQASVTCNAPIIIFHEVLLKTKLPIEAHSVQVADVQVFLERHDEVFNVYLCDPAAVLPPPPLLPLSPADSPTMLSQDGPTMSKKGDQSKHEEQAERLVQDMLQAVQSLGRAAQQGGLQGAIRQQGLEIAERLKGLSSRNRNTDNLEQGVRVMEHVGKAAVKSLQAPKRILPDREVGDDAPPPPDVRVGRIVLKDLRLFSKDSWIPMSTSSNGKDQPSDAATEKPAAKGEWNKPIFIESLVVRAAELCPPMSLKDDDDLPAVYQPVDKIIEIVWRRLLAEMAKSNTGRLFSTAFGEVISFMKSSPAAGLDSNVTTNPNPVDSSAIHTESTSTKKKATKAAKPKKKKVDTPPISSDQPMEVRV